MYICRYLGADDTSGMSVIEVRMTSGWIPDQSSIQRLMNSAELRLKKYEMDKKHPDVVVFYFDEVRTIVGCGNTHHINH